MHIVLLILLLKRPANEYGETGSKINRIWFALFAAFVAGNARTPRCTTIFEMLGSRKRRYICLVGLNARFLVRHLRQSLSIL